MRNIFSRYFLQFIVAALVIGAFVFFGAREQGTVVRGFVGKIALVFAHVSGSFASLLGGMGTGNKEFDEILRENQRLKALLLELDAARRENEELRTALAFSKEKNVNMRAAPVLYYSEEFGKEVLVVGAGTADGVRKGDYVLDGNGILVGIVEDAESSFSIVSIASNGGMTFEVEFVPLGVRALARGLGGGAFGIELLPPDSKVRAGDYIAATAGGSTSFLLGEITSSNASISSVFLEARAVRLARPEQLSTVFVAGVINEARLKK